MQKKIIIAEDHPLFRSALRFALRDIVDDVQLSEADSIDVLQRIMEKREKADLILLDLNMPGAHGFSGLHFIKGQYPECPVVVISSHEDTDTMVKAMHIGAVAYIPKSSQPEILKEALATVIKGNQWFTSATKEAFQSQLKSKANKTEVGIAALTPQQFRILGMIGEGLLNKQIGYELGISEATVKAHVTAIFKKLGVRNRTQAVIVLKELEIDLSESENVIRNEDIHKRD